MQSYVLHKDDPRYPVRLGRCPDAPDTLYGIGPLDLNAGHWVSIVGTRHASERCRELTTTLVRRLAEQIPDLVVVSGLAYGIDVAAHRAAIECGIPTLIVPGHGLDRMYPQVHRPVAVSALERGCILTEYAEGTPIYASNFLQRDRIIAGLSDCTIVVESAARGGSLCTARFARRYNRPVFAFPGRPNDANSEGCNLLIREHKAQLLLSADDVVRTMGWKSQQVVQTSLFEPEPESEIGREILRMLRQEENGLQADEITRRMQQPYSTIATELTMLELDGFVVGLSGGVYWAKNG